MRNSEKCRQLLDDELLDDIEETLKGYYVEMWHRQQDQAKREQLWLAFNMVDDLRVAITTLAQTGELHQVVSDAG